METGAPATAYSDPNGETPLGSSVVSDADGRVAVFLHPSRYRINVVSAAGVHVEQIIWEPVVGDLAVTNPSLFGRMIVAFEPDAEGVLAIDSNGLPTVAPAFSIPEYRYWGIVDNPPQGEGMRSLAIGDGIDIGDATHSVFIGNESSSTAHAPGSGYHVVVGESAAASTTGQGNVVIGHGAETLNGGAVSIGQYATAEASRSVSIGLQASAMDQSIAVGGFASAEGFEGSAVGINSHAAGQFSTAVGAQSYAPGNHSVAVGRNALATAGDATAAGSGAMSSAGGATALGRSSQAHGEGAIAVGRGAQSVSSSSVAIGEDAVAAGSASWAGGMWATATGAGATSTGQSSFAPGITAAAYGMSATAQSDNATALGAYSTAYGVNGLAVGAWSHAEGDGDIAIGAVSTASAPGDGPKIRIGSGSSDFWQLNNDGTILWSSSNHGSQTFDLSDPVGPTISAEIAALQAGKQDVLGYTPEDVANRGAPNGYTPLGADSRVPAAYLPSYVDDVLEFPSVADFPAVGSAGVLYVAADANSVYRWSGSAYAEIVGSPGSTDAVPEGTVNLYFTNARAVSAVQSQLDARANASVNITAGTGLTGGGDLTNSRTLSVVYGTGAETAAQGNDPRLSNAREWTAATVSQAEAEAGVATERRAWTAQRVRQAITAWWTTIGTTVGRNLLNITNPGSVRFIRINADNSVSTRTAAELRADIGAGTGGGTVTSVALSAPAGFVVGGSPITGAGTLALNYASGYQGYTTADASKLSGISAGATANQSDAYLLNRANHTGTQPVGAITGLGTAATADVTVSSADTTAGRVLRVGDFGLGAGSINVSDIASGETSVGRFFRTGPAVPGAPPFGGVAGAISLPATPAGAAGALAVGSTTAFVGYKLGATATHTWRELWHAGNFNPSGYAPLNHQHDRLMGSVTSDLNILPTANGTAKFETYSISAANKPDSNDNANGVLTFVTHGTVYGRQFAFQNSEDIYTRRFVSGTPHGWRRMWHSGNLLDIGTTAAAARTALGLGTAAISAATDFVQLTGTQTISGSKTFTSSVTVTSAAPVSIVSATAQPLNYIHMATTGNGGGSAGALQIATVADGTEPRPGTTALRISGASGARDLQITSGNAYVNGSVFGNNLMYTSGDQDIAGFKQFTGSVRVNGPLRSDFGALLFPGGPGNQAAAVVFNYSGETSSRIKFDGLTGSGANNSRMVWEGASSRFRFTNSAETANVDIECLNLITTSARRYKTEIETLMPDGDAFDALRPVTYRDRDTGNASIGVVAEELLELYPELVSLDPAGQCSGVNYPKMVALLIAELQDVRRRVALLEAQ